MCVYAHAPPSVYKGGNCSVEHFQVKSIAWFYLMQTGTQINLFFFLLLLSHKCLQYKIYLPLSGLSKVLTFSVGCLLN